MKHLLKTTMRQNVSECEIHNSYKILSFVMIFAFTKKKNCVGLQCILKVSSVLVLIKKR